MAHEAVRKAGNQTANAAGVSRASRGSPTRLLSLNAIHALQDFMRGRELAPICKERENVVERHLIDFRGRITAACHEAGIDEVEIDAGSFTIQNPPA
ncbi:MAG: hypothetical protein L0Y57_15570 [Beijerinckiaceae bacterium]|nr:hypothetical protein [Beijerinckiaceae bacterium]